MGQPVHKYPDVREVPSPDAGALPAENIAIELTDLSKSYGAHPAVRIAALAVRAGEFLTLLGPSGSGKTTTLMLVAGHQTPDAGKIAINGGDVTTVPAYRREIGMVFQNHALFPHLDVFHNVAFPLRMRKWPKPAIKDAVAAALALVHLDQFADRYPAQLSGGQSQRVALARALVFQPSILLMDEPLSALDKHLREELQVEIRGLQKRLGLTALYVTHDQNEAMVMSDRIAVFEGGTIAQIGTARDLYETPSSLFVAKFLGETSILEGRVSRTRERATVVDMGDGTELVGIAARPLGPGAHVAVCLRPEAVSLGRPARPGDNRIKVKIKSMEYKGHHWRVSVQSHAASDVVVYLENQGSGTPFFVGQELIASFDAKRTSIIPMEG